MQPHSEESSALFLHWDALVPWTALGWEKLVNEAGRLSLAEWRGAVG